MTQQIAGWNIHPAAELFPLLTGDELAELVEDISTHGLIEPVWLYQDPDRGTVLLDGRNRALACEKAGVEIRTRVYTGDDPIGFSIAQNLKRRHLTAGQKAAVAHAALPLFEEEARRRKAAAVAERHRREAEERRRSIEAQEQRSLLTAEPNVEESDVMSSLECADRHTLGAEELPQQKKVRAGDHAAQIAGTSGRAVARYKRVAEQAPDLAEKVRDGSLALDRAERIIRDRQAEQRRIEQARREAELTGTPTRVDIRHGDFRDTLADLRDIDAIITDPPYPREFLPLLADLAAWADKVLTPDGVLAVLIGQTHLPEVYRLLDGHRPYRWTACYLTEGPGYVSHPRRVSSNWKPLLVYGGGPRFADVIRSEGTDAHAKSLHKWGQDYNAFHTIIERLTDRGQTVVDPFMGAGTTLLAAHALGRHAIGCDIDEHHVATARERLS